ncbi:MAG: MmgE/PrpD family protein [Lautropia sp.]
MLEEVGRLAADVSWRGLGEDARRKLKLCLLANLSVAVAGVRHVKLPCPPVVAAASTGAQGRGAAHLLFSGQSTTLARDAAFWNAAAMHARTQDDFHPIGNLHAATVLVPAALAMAERVGGVTGERFLDAIAAGYAVAAGLSCAFSPLTTPKGLRSTSLYSPFAAAVAAARIAALPASGIANAIALASSMAGGLTQCWIDGSDEWQLHVAQAAANGLLAVELTQAGVTGASHALDGAAGFYHAHAGMIPVFGRIAKDFDADRAILDTVIKRYPVSGICQPVVRAAERLAERLVGARERDGGASPARVTDIRILMNEFEMRYPGTLNRGPFRSFSDVLMSAAFCSASVLSCGRFDFDDLFTTNPERDRLISLTRVDADPALSTLSCRLELTFESGERVVESLIDGGSSLAIDMSTIDDWARALWRDAGRPETQYGRLREAVDALEHAELDALTRAWGASTPRDRG